MTKTVLILGSTGRFGRNATAAFQDAGWRVRTFDRKTQSLQAEAQGVDVIVNAWNPQYPDWERQVPKLHKQVISAATETGATVVVPGNVYVFDANAPGPWSADTPHEATNPLGRIRAEMEDAYRFSPVRTIILRAGDFIDTCASGNWIDQVIAKPLQRGWITYPGDPDIPHSWAYLPDLARTAVELAERRASLPRFCDVSFAGYTLTGSELAKALSRVTGAQVLVKPMRWWPIYLARPFWRLAPHLIEMRYLWNVPHSLDGTALRDLLGRIPQTDLDVALRNASPEFRVSQSQSSHAVGA